VPPTKSNDAVEMARLLRTSGPAVVFTGAGMSTESGLPDFRSAGGLWRNRRFEELASRDSLAERYDEFVAFYRWRMQMLKEHEPHAGHRVLADWQRRGLVDALITQNVDGYHTAAGARDVLELHGTLRLVRCETCGTEATGDEFLTPSGEACACGGRRRPNVVLFGEMLPKEALSASVEASRRARLFIVLGSSLLVSPANLLPEMALDAGAPLVIVNRDPTPLGPRATLEIRSSIGDVLTAVDEILQSQSP
jgi:NAD-dependent deacetylase